MATGFNLFGEKKLSSAEIDTRLERLEAEGSKRMTEQAALSAQIAATEADLQAATSEDLLDKSAESSRRCKALKAKLRDLKTEYADLQGDLERARVTEATLSAERASALERELCAEWEAAAQKLLKLAQEAGPLIITLGTLLRAAGQLSEKMDTVAWGPTKSYAAFRTRFRTAVLSCIARSFDGCNIGGLPRPIDYRPETLANALALAETIEEAIRAEREKLMAALKTPKN